MTTKKRAKDNDIRQGPTSDTHRLPQQKEGIDGLI